MRDEQSFLPKRFFTQSAVYEYLSCDVVFLVVAHSVAIPASVSSVAILALKLKVSRDTCANTLDKSSWYVYVDLVGVSDPIRGGIKKISKSETPPPSSNSEASVFSDKEIS